MTRWLTERERATWVRFAAVVELLPGALDAQLIADSGLTHFEYFTLAMLSEAPDRTLRLTALASRTNATLPRLSRVLTRLEERDLVRRAPCAQDKRATNAILTPTGWSVLTAAAPGHVERVRELVVDALDPDQIDQLGDICDRLLGRLDPDGRMSAAATAAPDRVSG